VEGRDGPRERRGRGPAEAGGGEGRAPAVAPHAAIEDSRHPDIFVQLLAQYRVRPEEVVVEILESAVESLQAAIAAEAAGSARLELCADLAVGGTTPPIALVREVTGRAAIPVFVMVRPRGGSFVYSAAERAVMRRDIAAVAAAGALVWGAAIATVGIVPSAFAAPARRPSGHPR